MYQYKTEWGKLSKRQLIFLIYSKIFHVETYNVNKDLVHLNIGRLSLLHYSKCLKTICHGGNGKVSAFLQT